MGQLRSTLFRPTCRKHWGLRAARTGRAENLGPKHHTHLDLALLPTQRVFEAHSRGTLWDCRQELRCLSLYAFLLCGNFPRVKKLAGAQEWQDIPGLGGAKRSRSPQSASASAEVPLLVNTWPGDVGGA